MKNTLIKITVAIALLFGFIPTFAQDDGTASIYIKRQSMVGAIAVQSIELNGVFIGPIHAGTCLRIDLHPGVYELKYYNVNITSKEQLGKWLPNFTTVFSLKAGDKKYLKITMKASGPSYSDANGGKEFEKIKTIFDYEAIKKVQESHSNHAVARNNDSQQQNQRSSDSGESQTIAQQPVQQVSAAESSDFKSDVDVNIPKTNKNVENTYVLIIANEDYQFIDKVKYAARDGEIFKEYCIKTLGVPEKQVRYCPNASFGVINGGVDWLRYALENFEGSRGIVYYCGHGIPDEHTGDAYIIPVDGKGTNMTTCYSLNNLYKTLAATNAESITYFMDACFTGANKEGSMLVAARGVAREAKKETLEGNAIVFSASSGDETAMIYEEKHHGLFTYYLLKKLQETQGEVSYEDLAAYISKNVKKDAFLLNEKPQNPVVATSPNAQDSWKTMNLK